MTDLRTAALRALKALKVAQDHWNTYHGLSSVTIDEAADMLREALAQPEDKSQAAFEHWVETVEATQGCAISRNAVVDKLLTVTPAQMAHAEAVEPMARPITHVGTYYGKKNPALEQPIIQPEIKGHNVKPPPEAQAEAEKIAYCAGWWAAMEAKREQNPQEKLLPWKGLTEEEHNYYKACGFVGVKAVEEKLRARNSTLVSK